MSFWQDAKTLLRRKACSASAWRWGVVWLCGAGLLVALSPDAAAQRASAAVRAGANRQSDQTVDTADFQGRMNTEATDLLLRTLPKLGEFQVNLVLPVYWQTNVQDTPRGGPGAVETNPSVDVRWSRRLDDVPIRLAVRIGADITRYSRFQSENGDDAYIGTSATYSDANDDQALAPYVSYRVKTLSGPALADWYETRNEFNVGITKTLNLDADLAMLPAGANTAKDASWSVSAGAAIQRRLRNPGPDSTAETITIGVSWVEMDSLAINVGTEIVWRSYDSIMTRSGNNLAEQRFTVDPVISVVWDAGSVDPLLPKLGLSLAFEHEASSKTGTAYQQWTMGPFLAARWRF